MLSFNTLIRKTIALIREDIIFSCVIAISIVLSLLNILWWILDVAPPKWDQAFYLEASQILYGALVDGGILGLLREFVTILEVKAPFISLIPIPFYIFFGNSELSAMLVNICFIFLFSIYFYKLGVLFFDKKTAILAVYVAQTMPLLAGLSREFLVEYGLSSIVVMFYYQLILLFKTNKSKHAMFLGFLTGIGLLMKVNFLIYIAIPCVYIIFLRIRSKGTVKWFREIVYFLLPCLVIAVPWYINNYKSVFSFGLQAGYGSIAKGYDYGLGYLESLSLYVSDYAKNGLSLYYSILFCFSISLFVVKIIRSNLYHIVWRKLDPFFFCLLWVLPILFLFSFSPNKIIRFLAPVTPAIALFVANGIRLTFIQNWVKVIILIVPLISLITQSFFVCGIDCTNNSYINKYDYTNWKLNEIIDLIYSERIDNPMLPERVYISEDLPYLNLNNFSFYSNLLNSRKGLVYTHRVNWDVEEEIKRINEYNPGFIVSLKQTTERGWLQSWLTETANGYIYLESINIDDKQTIEIYKKKV